jgi:hypothetical protein
LHACRSTLEDPLPCEGVENLLRALPEGGLKELPKMLGLRGGPERPQAR